MDSIILLQSFGAKGTDVASFSAILLQAIIVVAVVALMAIGSGLLGPKRKTKEKNANFESGIPAIGNARQPMAIKYFLVAILFVLVDVQVIFFYPYAVNFKGLGVEGFLAVLLFLFVFICGFYYVIKKGALDWDQD